MSDFFSSTYFSQRHTTHIHVVRPNSHETSKASRSEREPVIECLRERLLVARFYVLGQLTARRLVGISCKPCSGPFDKVRHCRRRCVCWKRGGGLGNTGRKCKRRKVCLHVCCPVSHGLGSYSHPLLFQCGRLSSLSSTASQRHRGQQASAPAMSHFVSTSGANFDDLHHQLLQRQPVEGSAQDEEELERSLHQEFRSHDEGNNVVDEGQAPGSTATAAAGDTAHVLSPALASRRRPDLSRPTTTYEQDTSSRASSPFGGDKDGKKQRSVSAAVPAPSSKPRRERKLSDPDEGPAQTSLASEVGRGTPSGPRSGATSPTSGNRTRRNSAEDSSSHLQANAQPAMHRSAQYQHKEVTFDKNEATTIPSDAKRNLARSNSNVPDMRSRYNQQHHHHHHHHHHHPHHHLLPQDGEQGRQHHVLSPHAQSRLRSAGMISQAEMPPRKLGTWDGVFMPVSLNVSQLCYKTINPALCLSSPCRRSSASFFSCVLVSSSVRSVWWARSSSSPSRMPSIHSQ